jgi:hypothetical protein
MVKESILDIPDPLSVYLKFVMDSDLDVELQNKKSASQKKPIALPVVEVYNSIYKQYAVSSKYIGTGIEQHFTFQKWIIENVEMCVACEVPCFDDKESCFIDAIFLNTDDGYVDIVDLKPHAINEDPKKVASQLFTNRRLLSYSAGIPPQGIRCFYTDDKHTYEVKFTK